MNFLSRSPKDDVSVLLVPVLEPFVADLDNSLGESKKLPRMIFHYPMPLASEAKSGSQIRPRRMLEAFKSIGYEVFEVVGDASARRESVRRLKQQLSSGMSFDFLYSESTTMPTLLTETHHLPSHPAVDFNLFAMCQRHHIPVGLFYRDIHWRFEQYRRHVKWYKRMVAIPFYMYDLMQYRRLVNHLFLPSVRMAFYLPGNWDETRITALPPGLIPYRRRGCATTESDVALEILYVGGVTPPLYDIQPMIDAVVMVGEVRLTLCCRENEWKEARLRYRMPDSENIVVVHRYGDELTPYFEKADVLMMVWNPTQYMDFAMPVKLFEALGHGLPVIATEGTEAGRFVTNAKVGWTVPPNPQIIAGLITDLVRQRDAIEEVRRNVIEIREKHTWTARARTVASALKKGESG